VYAKDACVPVSINENDLKDALLDMLGKQAEVLGIGDAISQKQPTMEQAADKSELQRLQSEIAKTSHFLKSLYESLISNDITHDEYRELKTGYEAKISDLTEKEKALRDGIVERIAKEAVFAKATANLKGIRQIADLTADSIDRLIDKILVFADKHIEVQFKFADSMTISNESTERRMCSA